MEATINKPIVVTPAARVRAATDEPLWVKLSLVSLTVGFLTLFLFVPLLAVFTEALRKGLGAYLTSLTDPAALSAIRLTLLTVAIAVPLYKNWPIVRRKALPMVAALIAGTATSIVSAIAVAAALGVPRTVVISLAPKSVTAAVAMGEIPMALNLRPKTPEMA